MYNSLQGIFKTMIGIVTYVNNDGRQVTMLGNHNYKDTVHALSVGFNGY